MSAVDPPSGSRRTSVVVQENDLGESAAIVVRPRPEATGPKRIQRLLHVLIGYATALTARLGDVDPLLVDPWSFSGCIGELEMDTGKAL